MTEAMSPKRITIDDLAMMVQKGFVEIYDRLFAIEERLTQVETIMATKEDLISLESRLMYRIERRFEPLEEGLRKRNRLID